MARSGEVEIPAPNLEPETYTQFEIGLKSRALGIDGGFSAFYMDIRDQIKRFPTNEVTPDDEIVVDKANVGDGYLWGLEVTLVYELGWGLSLRG